MTREELERCLLAAVGARRLEYEVLRDEYRRYAAISADAAGTSDGTVASARALAAASGLRSATAAYQQALKDFSGFIVHGNLPKKRPPPR